MIDLIVWNSLRLVSVIFVFLQVYLNSPLCQIDRPTFAFPSLSSLLVPSVKWLWRGCNGSVYFTFLTYLTKTFCIPGRIPITYNIWGVIGTLWAWHLPSLFVFIFFIFFFIHSRLIVYLIHLNHPSFPSPPPSLWRGDCPPWPPGKF